MKTIAFTVCDQQNEKYAINLEKTFKHFHPDIEFYTVKGEELQKYLKDDPNFYYRQKPILMDRFFKEGYELIIGLDSDQLILGDLNEILENKYDVAVVHNYNRVDSKIYGEIGFGTIQPQEYLNCGLVAVQSREFVKQWLRLCYSTHFDRMPYREQGFLNILCYYGDFSLKFLDLGDSFYGLASKGEWDKCVMKDGHILLPASDYSNKDKIIRVAHNGGGNTPNKLNYRIYFNEDCIKFIDSLITNERNTTN